MSLSEALGKADDFDTDLVEIAPKAEPPVCRLMDYGKFKYAQSKKLHEARMKQKNVQVKEVKFSIYIYWISIWGKPFGLIVDETTL